MKAAISIFVVFLVAAFFLMVRKPKDEQKPVLLPNVQGSAAAAKAGEVKNLTTISWIDSVKHMGSVKSGEKVEIAFRFKNTGDQQLIVSDVIVSCGCTVAEKPQRPIAPGEEGVIKAEFNSTGRIGSNHKTISVHTNTPDGGISTLKFDVDVLQ